MEACGGWTELKMSKYSTNWMGACDGEDTEDLSHLQFSIVLERWE